MDLDNIYLPIPILFVIHSTSSDYAHAQQKIRFYVKVWYNFGGS